MKKYQRYRCKACNSSEPWLYGVLNKKGGFCFVCYSKLVNHVPTHPDQLDLFKEAS